MWLLCGYKVETLIFMAVLNDIIRVRCETDLKRRLRVIARRKSVKGRRALTPTELARDALIIFAESEEAKLRTNGHHKAAA